MVHVRPCLFDSVVIRSPRRFRHGFNARPKAIGRQLHSRVVGDGVYAAEIAPNRLAMSVSVVCRSRALNVRALGGKVPHGAAHQASSPSLAGERFGGGIACGLRGGRIGFRLKVQFQFDVIGLRIFHFVSPHRPMPIDRLRSMVTEGKVAGQIATEFWFDAKFVRTSAHQGI